MSNAPGEGDHKGMPGVPFIPLLKGLYGLKVLDGFPTCLWTGQNGGVEHGERGHNRRLSRRYACPSTHEDFAPDNVLLYYRIRD